MNTSKKHTPRVVTFSSHHITNIVDEALSRLSIATQGELERELAHGETADEEMIALYELRLSRINVARNNMLDSYQREMAAAS